MMNTIWTVGHSTHTADDLLNILTAHHITVLADVRRFPASRRYPHFNGPELAKLLHTLNIDYVHFPELGGRRQPRLDSHNTAWRNESFRGYADYMETSDFESGVARLLALADNEEKHIAIMCAEALWWRCHRSLISDTLKVRGYTVLHIMDAKKTEPHPYTSAARIIDGKLSYTDQLTLPFDPSTD